MSDRSVLFVVGTFDPPVPLSLDIVYRIMGILYLDAAYILPVAEYEKGLGASLDQRLEMCRMAYSSEEFRVLDPRNRVDSARITREVSSVKSKTELYILCLRPKDGLEKELRRLCRNGYEELMDPSPFTSLMLLSLLEKSLRRLTNGTFYQYSVLNYIAENKLYKAKDIYEMYEPSRYEHALSVARLAATIAAPNGVDFRTAYVMGLYHDIGKKTAFTEKGKRIMQTVTKKLGGMPSWSYHQFVGANIAKRVFGVTEKVVLDAIACHTTGRGEMTAYDKIIYAADKIDPRRGWDSKDFIDMCMEDIDSGFVAVLKNNMRYIDERTGATVVDPLTRACMKTYLEEDKS